MALSAVFAALAAFVAGQRVRRPPPSAAGTPHWSSGSSACSSDGQGPGGSLRVSVAVIDHGKVTRAALGTTDGSTPITPDTVFETASAQKVLTASLLGSLLGAGRIRLTDTVGGLWPEYTFVDPAVAGITTEQLATDTAGLPSTPPDCAVFPLAMARLKPMASSSRPRPPHPQPSRPSKLGSSPEQRTREQDQGDVFVICKPQDGATEQSTFA
ncbi:serine hydrolase domain-containing protein [Streptomyces sp. NPDC007369]|uniref:serine hydrolase domain-containing protein n=1 Tax=Streptomyces sp. NPDC007369 TaxID=3154589 RepID=UPI0033E35CC2